MAIVTSGPYVGFRGTIDGITYYPGKRGETIAKKKNKPRSVPLSKKQLARLDETAIVAKFMLPFKEFVSVGYGLEAIVAIDNPYNMMVRQLRRYALAGDVEARYINYPKVSVTKGKMTVVQSAEAEIFETGIRYKWNTAISDSSMHWSDQVVLLAYFPELDEIRYLSAGPERHAGEAILQLLGTPAGFTAEVYIAFVSSGRTSISNSTHLGQLNW